VTVTHCGRICLGKRKINLCQAFAGQNVGIKEVSDRIWLVTFMHYDLGFFDHEICRLEPSPTRSNRKCYLCLRYKTLPM
jgi:putative transposase